MAIIGVAMKGGGEEEGPLLKNSIHERLGQDED